TDLPVGPTATAHISSLLFRWCSARCFSTACVDCGESPRCVTCAWVVGARLTVLKWLFESSCSVS
ncbi:unnamed protein product, partial [Amoebophrya sp. A120]